MPLTDTKIRAAKPADKNYRLSDEKGMYLEVTKAGGRYWRMKYRYQGKEKLLALGVYPDVSLAQARAKRDEARALLADDTDPGQARKAAKREKAKTAANSFEVIAREWHGIQAAGRWTEGHATKTLQGLEKHIFPELGHRPISEITAGELLAVLKAMQAGGTIDRANRLRQTCGEVFRYGIATGTNEGNPAADLVRTLQASPQRHFAALSKDQLPDFLQALKKEHRASPVTCLGLKLLTLTFVRPGELRQAQWEEFDIEAGMWEVPAERMKMRVSHLVPLSPETLATLEQLRELTGNTELLFPGRSNIRKPISDNTWRQALHAMGYKVTAHGFRATASTILNEMGYRADAIERQLSHGERNKVRAAYNRAEYLKERREMMNHWGKLIGSMSKDRTAIPILKQNNQAS
ncbi:integrase [Alcanivorax sp. 97CO-5]|jgi:integrase|uniref:tyrosine-type recombinase/integrase n=1 Tax=unclassified Alcanivorax TaxID=2638842 RepID=UPI0003E7F890|nr:MULTISPECIES: integrase arm-type DNA-binding domain-containing protein [unclassified Alcanivorax]EUC68045.1 integrase [Alcanivorax sp. 97CO-5]PKG00466.1 integrase [Alcanivorax sp. 97CO-6]